MEAKIAIATVAESNRTATQYETQIFHVKIVLPLPTIHEKWRKESAILYH